MPSLGVEGGVRHAEVRGAVGATWRDGPEGVLSFSREPGFVCVVNLSAEPYELPGLSALLVAGGPVEGGVLGPDQAVWLTV